MKKHRGMDGWRSFRRYTRQIDGVVTGRKASSLYPVNKLNTIHIYAYTMHVDNFIQWYKPNTKLNIRSEMWFLITLSVSRIN